MPSRLRLGASESGWCSTVWIDPGGITGWGVMVVEPVDLIGEKPLHSVIAHWACGEITGPENAQASEILQLYDMWDDAAIGIESFVIRKFLQHKEFLSPVRIREKVDYGLWLAEKWSAEDDEREMGRGRWMFTQTPSMAMTTLTDERQKEWGLWVPGRDHKRDAIKHCYTFLKRSRESARLRYTAWPLLFQPDGNCVKRRASPSKRKFR